MKRAEPGEKTPQRVRELDKCPTCGNDAVKYTGIKWMHDWQEADGACKRCGDSAPWEE